VLARTADTADRPKIATAKVEVPVAGQVELIPEQVTNSTLTSVNLVQAIILLEILAPPKAKQMRRRR